MLKKGGKTWKQEEIDGALSEVALTAAVMSHKLLHDRISHSVGHKLGAVKKKQQRIEHKGAPCIQRNQLNFLQSKHSIIPSDPETFRLDEPQ